MKKLIRKRDAAATRDSIILAAQNQFSQNGFDGAGLREIAAEAGINVALINRYFGSKEGLFEEAVASSLNVEEFLGGNKETFGARLAEKIGAVKTTHENAIPNLAVIRSVGSAKVQSTLKELIERQAVNKIADWLDGDDRHQRAALIVSHLLGFDLLYRVVSIDALGIDQADKIRDRFAKVIQGYVDDTD